MKIKATIGLWIKNPFIQSVILVSAYYMFALVLAVILIWTPQTTAQHNPANIGNGWYPNLPPVTEAEINLKISCLVAAGAPANPKLVTAPLAALPQDLKFGPTQIEWSMTKQGEQLTIQTDAVLTRYGPRIAWVEIAHVFGLDINAPVFCPDAVPLVQIKNPVGKPRPDWCDKCFESIGADDKFEVGARFTAPDGTYAKHRRWFAFIPSGYWIRE